MVEKTQRFLVAVLRFHGDVLLTTPMINEIKENYPDSIIDLLVYKGTGSILESDHRVNNIIEAEPSSNANVIKRIFKEILENLIGTRAAQLLDQNLKLLGKVPISELPTTIKSLNNTAYAVVFDGIVDRDITKAAETANVKFIVGMDSKLRPNESSASILTVKDL